MSNVRAVLGTFDGVHVGHRALFSRATQLSAKDGLTPAAIVIYREGELITSMEERRALLREAGAAEVYVLHLDEIRRKSADEFIEYIKEEYGVCAAVCGYDFRYGRGRMGSALTLCEKLTTEVVPEQRIDSQTVSSTAVRALLAEGNAEGAAVLLGREHSISATVAKGKQLGRTRGYPTANIPYPEWRCPLKKGVYFTRVTTRHGVFDSISNVGTCPTVGGRESVIESYLLHYDGSLYGEEITVSFLHYHRGEKCFSDIDALYAQISADKEAAEEYFLRK